MRPRLKACRSPGRRTCTVVGVRRHAASGAAADWRLYEETLKARERAYETLTTADSRNQERAYARTRSVNRRATWTLGFQRACCNISHSGRVARPHRRPQPARLTAASDSLLLGGGNWLTQRWQGRRAFAAATYERRRAPVPKTGVGQRARLLEGDLLEPAAAGRCFELINPQPPCCCTGCIDEGSCSGGSRGSSGAGGYSTVHLRAVSSPVASTAGHYSRRTGQR